MVTGVSMNNTFRGIPYFYVRVINLQPPQAETVDRFGKVRPVWLSLQRTPMRPQVDEFWLIDHFYGMWTFAGRIDAEMCPLWVDCVVDSVGGDTAQVTDEFDRELTVTMNLDRVGTFSQSTNESDDALDDLVPPASGESWIVDCIYGEWSFAARKGAS